MALIFTVKTLLTEDLINVTIFVMNIEIGEGTPPWFFLWTRQGSIVTST